MKWIVGLGLNHRSGGAISLGSWLRDGATDGAEHVLRATHVVEQPEQLLAVRWCIKTVAQVVRLAELAAESLLTEAGARAQFDDLDVVVAADTAAMLEKRCVESSTHGLLIGRAARTGEHAISRLGRVARRLLRALPAPVIVAPPELRVRDIAAGPLLIATDLKPHSVPALHFAQALAKSVGRPIRVLHVAPEHSELAPAFVPVTLEPGVRAAYEQSARNAVARWGAAAGLSDDDIDLEFGRPEACILSAAKRIGAPIIVCGSRRSTATERIFHPSLGARLAAIAGCAVAIVPAPECTPRDEE